MHEADDIGAELRPNAAARAAAEHEHVARGEAERDQAIDDVAAREREALEHGAGDVRAVVAGGEPVQAAARVRAPHRRHRAGERRDERHALRAGGHARGERVELGVVGEAEHAHRPAHRTAG